MNNNKLKLIIFTTSALSMMMADIAAIDRPNNDQHNFGEQNIAARQEHTVQPQIDEAATEDLLIFLGQRLDEIDPENVRTSVEGFLNNGADVNAADALWDWTALMWAVENGNAVAATVLLEHDADVDAADADDVTALMKAAKYGQTEIVRTLIEHGANVDASDIFGNTALILAAENGHTEIVRTLIEHGANVNDVDVNDVTALMKAAENDHIDTVNALLEYSANVDDVDIFGNTALMIAEAKGYENISNILKECRVGHKKDCVNTESCNL